MSEAKQSPTYPKLKVFPDGSIVGPSGKTLSPMIDPRGYERVSLYLGHRRWKRVGVHSIVCEAFHGPRPSSRHVVAHSDGDPANNHPSNLRWATPEENEADKIAHGRSLRGERHHQVKLTEGQVREIRRRHSRGEYQKDLAREFGVSNYAVWALVNWKTWRHVQ